MESLDTRKDAFEWTSNWFKLSYEIKNQDGVDVICAVYGSEKQEYEPLKHHAPENRPKNREEQSKWGPIAGLSRLRVDDYSDILSFANRWGLLGLWRVKRYQLADDLDLSLPYRPLASSLSYGKYSTWFHHPHKSGIYRWQEPIKLFIEAVIEFQETLEELRELESNTTNSFLITNMRINDSLRGVRPALSWDETERLWIPGWNFASLLDAIYLQLFIDSQSGRHWRRCKKCNKFFLASNPAAMCCSDVCSNTHAKTDSRNRHMVEAISERYPYIDKEWIKQEAYSILRTPGIGEKKLNDKMEQMIKMEAAK